MANWLTDLLLGWLTNKWTVFGRRIRASHCIASHPFLIFSSTQPTQFVVNQTGEEGGEDSRQRFLSIYQIDLVPTISLLLGLPIPYANIGGVAPSLFPGNAAQVTAGLAWNAAQVWRYLQDYSSEANRLPNLGPLQHSLEQAVTKLKRALEFSDAADSHAYREATGLFKSFLLEAAALGRRVWTRFDARGMIIGAGLVIMSLLLAFPWQGRREDRYSPRIPKDGLRSWNDIAQSILRVDRTITVGFIVFHCILLHCSNSYIENEEKVLLFFVSILSLVIVCRCWRSKVARTVILVVVLIPLSAKINTELVSGHGLDSSIGMYNSHMILVFGPSLAVLAAGRVMYTSFGTKAAVTTPKMIRILHTLIDVGTLVVLIKCWWEKGSSDTNRNGYAECKIVFVAVLIGVFLLIVETCTISPLSVWPNQEQKTDEFFIKLAIALMAVTGPSSAPTIVLCIAQAWALHTVCNPRFPAKVRYRLHEKKTQRVHQQASFLDIAPYVLNDRTYSSFQSDPFVLGCLWRLSVRHVFYATNHGCAFNRLQLSSAFVSTIEFDFALGGISLFLNTFGWEILGAFFLYKTKRRDVWSWFLFFQLLETASSCVSVAVLRRHLMVWAVFAPRFIFTCVFQIIQSVAQVLVTFVPCHRYTRS